MAKKIKEQETFQIDTEEITKSIKEDINTTPVQDYVEPTRSEVKKKTKEKEEEKELVNCLRPITITVQYLPQPGTINNPKHLLYGGMAEASTFSVTVPRLRSGVFVDVLTKQEKDFLEHILGLEEGALNVYNKTNNFWDNSTEGGVSRVRIPKQGMELHLNDPIEYIQYKILLANKNLIAPDLYTLRDRAKATYRFVLVSNDDVNQDAKQKMSTKMRCYVEYGKIDTKPDILRAIIEIITGKPLATNTKIDYLQTKIGELIDADAKLFLKVATDPLLPTRILIKKAVEQGFISRRGDYYYLRSDNTPLCEGGEEPTMSMAAKYLANPKRQSIKLSLEASINQ